LTSATRLIRLSSACLSSGSPMTQFLSADPQSSSPVPFFLIPTLCCATSTLPKTSCVSRFTCSLCSHQMLPVSHCLPTLTASPGFFRTLLSAIPNTFRICSVFLPGLALSHLTISRIFFSMFTRLTIFPAAVPSSLCSVQYCTLPNFAHSPFCTVSVKSRFL